MNVRCTNPILGSLLGTAVGDALGLPYEGLSRRRVAAFGLAGHRFILGHGMLSDDTEHTLMVAAAWLENQNDTGRFQRAFAWKLRWWLLGLPAGVGLSTAKAIVKLWLGFPASRSGVSSAGNGAAMRSAILGVLLRDDPAKRREFALAACRVTHTDPRAEESALLVAEAAAMAANGVSVEAVLETLQGFISSDEMKARFASLRAALASARTVPEFAAEIGCERGVSGFAPNTVAVALFAWLRHRHDFQTAVKSVISCGGDTDTVAAITGGIAGAEGGEAGIPEPWLAGICDWPRSVNHIRRVADELTRGSARAPRVYWPFVLTRNIFFLVVVLLHGFRRLLPPY
ncbi:MAG: ADP-ribosylglycohydrolase family protein [Verrucomicrobiaceae bacterium]|nr:ADP-ribosylglycohydrolase family protein [Verrucomicrobiaceae bacterium]